MCLTFKTRGAAAVLATLLLVACSKREPPRHAEPPVAAARAFLDAVHQYDCDRAWSYLSTRSQLYAEQKSREMSQSKVYVSDRFTPRKLFCEPTSVHRFHQYVAESVTLKSTSSRNATVAVERHQPAGFLIPGLWSTRTEVLQAEMELVEQSDGWKVVLPRLR